MKLTDFHVGDRLLLRDLRLNTGYFEVEVLEVATKAVLVRYRQATERWIPDRVSIGTDLADWELIERLKPFDGDSRRLRMDAERIQKLRELWIAWQGTGFEMPGPECAEENARLKEEKGLLTEALANLALCGYHDFGGDYVELQVSESEVLAARRLLAKYSEVGE